jgi:hypothetical protein
VVDACPVFDLPNGLRVAQPKEELADRRRSGAVHCVEESPACQLDDAPRARPWVDTVSLGNAVRSSRSTSYPERLSSMAVAAPAHLAPTTTT